MYTLLEAYNLSKLNHEKVDYLNTPIMNKEIEESPGPNGEFTGESYQTHKEKLMPILLKHFKNIEEQGILSSSLHKAGIILIPKPDNITTRKENYMPISLINTIKEFSTK